MSAIQRLAKMLVSKSKYEAMEEESRSWICECPLCGHEFSVWDVGGIRYGAAGRPKMRLACPACGGRSWRTPAKKTGN